MNQEKCYVRFWDNSGNKKSALVLFKSTRIAENFIKRYENAGGCKQFSADVHGARSPKWRMQPDGKDEPFYFGANDLRTWNFLRLNIVKGES